MVLGLADGKFPEVKDRCGKNRRGMAFANPVDQVIEKSDTAGRDHRDGHTVSHQPGQWQIKTLAGAVAIHRGQQYLAGTERHHLLCIFDRIDARGTGHRTFPRPP